MRSRGTIVSVTVLLAAALSAGLFAGTAAAGHHDPPAGGTVSWTGNGTDSVKACAPGVSPYLHWIFTTAGNASVTSATLTLGGSGSGSYVMTQNGNGNGNGSWSVYTNYYDLNSLSAFVTYVGTLGSGNPVLTISSGCYAPTPPPDTTPPSCELTNYTTYGNSTEKSSITVTLLDTGSGIQSVVATGTNDTIVTSPFTAPTTSPVTVTANKTIQGQSATLKIVVTDAAGNQRVCDPVLHKGRHVAAQRNGLQRGATQRTAGMTVHVSNSSLSYGAVRPLTLSGRVRNAPAGATVTILSQPAGFRFMSLTPIASVKLQAGATFSYRFHPAASAFYAVSINGVLSPALRVAVNPLVQLSRIAAGHYRVDVTTTNPLFLAGKRVFLQESRGHRWVTIAKTRLAKSSGITEPTVLSSGRFAARKAVGHRLRAVIAETQAYSRGVSATIRG